MQVSHSLFFEISTKVFFAKTPEKKNSREVFFKTTRKTSTEIFQKTREILVPSAFKAMFVVISRITRACAHYQDTSTTNAIVALDIRK